MTLYLLQSSSADKYVLELYDNDGRRTHWTNWQNSMNDALTTPLSTFYNHRTVDQRITEFNNARKHLDGSTLAIHSTYTPETHPEMFL